MGNNFWTADGAPHWSADGADDWSADGYITYFLPLFDANFSLSMRARGFMVGYLPPLLAALGPRNFTVSYVPEDDTATHPPVRGVTWMATPST